MLEYPYIIDSRKDPKVDFSLEKQLFHHVEYSCLGLSNKPFSKKQILFKFQGNKQPLFQNMTFHIPFHTKSQDHKTDL